MVTATYSKTYILTDAENTNFPSDHSSVSYIYLPEWRLQETSFPKRQNEAITKENSKSIVWVYFLL